MVWAYAESRHQHMAMMEAVAEEVIAKVGGVVPRLGLAGQPACCLVSHCCCAGCMLWLCCMVCQMHAVALLHACCMQCVLSH